MRSGWRREPAIGRTGGRSPLAAGTKSTWGSTSDLTPDPLGECLDSDEPMAADLRSGQLSVSEQSVDGVLLELRRSATSFGDSHLGSPPFRHVSETRSSLTTWAAELDASERARAGTGVFSTHSSSVSSQSPIAMASSIPSPLSDPGPRVVAIPPYELAGLA
jgi:hypothetical protein